VLANPVEHALGGKMGTHRNFKGQKASRPQPFVAMQGSMYDCQWYVARDDLGERALVECRRCIETKRAALQITRLVSMRPFGPTRPALDRFFN